MATAVSVVLNRAADEMEKRGKSRGAIINRNGNVCAYGAIRIAAGGKVVKDKFGCDIYTSRMNWHLYSRAGKVLDNYLLGEKVYKKPSDSVAQWNDQNNKSTVIEALRKAANAHS